MTYPNAIKIPELNKTQLKNFFNKVEYTENGCWLWIGSAHKTGYGKVHVSEKRTCRACNFLRRKKHRENS